jgi:adenosylhomocysteine nucleosidase
MRQEIKPFASALSLEPRDGDPSLRSAMVGDTEVVATLAGVGMASAQRATERIIDAVAPDHVLVIGIAGGCAPELRVGDLLVPEVVIDARSGVEHRPVAFGPRPLAGRILSSDDFSTGHEVLAEHRTNGVDAVDMETGAIASVCEARAMPWTAFRAMSDLLEEHLLDDTAIDMIGPDGKPKFGPIAKYILLHPWHLPRFARLARDTNTATAAASTAAIDAIRSQH